MLWKKELVEAVVWRPSFDGFKCDVRLSEECSWKIPGQYTQAYLWYLTLVKEELKRVIRRIFDFIEKDTCKTLRKPCVCVLNGSVIYDSLWSHGLPPGSAVHGVFQARILEWIASSYSRGSSWPRIKPTSPTLQGDSLPLSHLGSPRKP